MESGPQVMTIMSQSVITEIGDGKKLYRVSAVDENGQPIEEALRTFAELPLRKAMEFEVEEYNHERHGRSWTIHAPRVNSAERLTKVEKRLDDLIDRIGAIETELRRLRTK